MKQTISIKFTMPDGTDGTRSTMEDIDTLADRIYLEAFKIIRDNEETMLKFNESIINYNNFNFEAALNSFKYLHESCPGLKAGLQPYIEVCERLGAIELVGSERDQLEAQVKYLNASKFKRNFMQQRTPVARCKYCGRLTKYINPNDGFAYLNQNNCSVCSRSYPMADGVWDSTDGQAYIYYRNSVKEEIFYKEFEDKYDVQEDRTYFLKT